MLKLRTKTEKTVAFERTTKNVIVHLIIDSVTITRNNANGKGYYYYFDENGKEVKLSDIDTLTELALFEQIETNLLPPLASTQSSIENTKQRLKETTLLNIQQEEGASYGITVEDLIDDI